MNRSERTAIYLTPFPETVPLALLHNLRHNQVLHRRNLLVHVTFVDRPWVAASERVQVRDLGRDFWDLTVTFGFMETPDVPQALAGAKAYGLDLPEFESTYFLSRETVVPTPSGELATWRKRLFAAMSRNAGGLAPFLRLPDNAVVELGTRVPI